MRIRTAMVIALVLSLIFCGQALAQGQIQVQSIQSQIVGSPDSAGNVQFKVTAIALNPTMYGTEFSVQVQGLESNGSPLTNVTLRGRIGGRETGTLTGQGSLPEATYGSIVNWTQAK